MVNLGYFVNPKHRAMTPTTNASICRVCQWREISLCAEAGVRGWLADGVLWNSSMKIGEPGDVLGEDLKGNLWVAKFVCNHNNEWHGYPVRAVGHDIPPDNAIQDWQRSGRVKLSIAQRMRKGSMR